MVVSDWVFFAGMALAWVVVVLGVVCAPVAALTWLAVVRPLAALAVGAGIVLGVVALQPTASPPAYFYRGLQQPRRVPFLRGPYETEVECERAAALEAGSDDVCLRMPRDTRTYGLPPRPALVH